MQARLFMSPKPLSKDNSRIEGIKGLDQDTYIHGTTSSLFFSLPSTEFCLCSGEDLLYTYNLAPSSGEIHKGGYAAPFYDGQPAFGRIKGTKGGYNFKNIIVSYATTATERPISNVKCYQDYYIRENGFRDINMLLFKILRGAVDKVLFENIENDLENEINHLYACWFLLTYIKNNSDLYTFISQKMNECNIKYWDKWLPLHRHSDLNKAKKTFLKKEDAALLYALIDNPRACAHSDLPTMLTAILHYFFNQKIKMSADEMDKHFKLNEENEIEFEYKEDDSHDNTERFRPYIFYDTSNLKIVLKLLSNEEIKEIDILQLNKDLYISFLRQLIKRFEEALTIIRKVRMGEIKPLTVKSKIQLEFIKNPFPVVLLVEKTNDKLDGRAFNDSEYRVKKGSKLVFGEDIKKVVVGSEKNALFLRKYFSRFKKNVEVITDKEVPVSTEEPKKTGPYTLSPLAPLDDYLFELEATEKSLWKHQTASGEYKSAWGSFFGEKFGSYSKEKKWKAALALKEYLEKIETNQDCREQRDKLFNYKGELTSGTLGEIYFLLSQHENFNLPTEIYRIKDIYRCCI